MAIFLWLELRGARYRGTRRKEKETEEGEGGGDFLRWNFTKFVQMFRHRRMIVTWNSRRTWEIVYEGIFDTVMNIKYYPRHRSLPVIIALNRESYVKCTHLKRIYLWTNGFLRRKNSTLDALTSAREINIDPYSAISVCFFLFSFFLVVWFDKDYSNVKKKKKGW